MKYNTLKLASGLRIIQLPSASPVVYCGFQIAAGTRNELPGEEGLAHFCEHMTFKGTRRRTAIQIINALEGLGGELNAYTNKESTVFYAAIWRDHLRSAVDVLADMVFHSEYPQTEIDREVEVICDEIESYNDSPAELIYDDFENLLFEGHPLGHNILGQADQLRSYTTDDALQFVRRHYRPDNTVFFAYGDVDFDRLCRLVEDVMGEMETNEATDMPNAMPMALSTKPGVVVREKGTHQAHVMIGTPAYHAHHERRMALYLLNNILGGPSMNARLNLSLRERHGLVYTVESSMVCYGDTGVWSTYFGCDPHDVNRCRRLVRHELDRLMTRFLSKSRLASAKQQLKGQIAIAYDSREQFALDFGKTYLFDGRERHLDDLFKRIDLLTAEDLQQVACELFAEERLTTLIYH